MTPANIFPLSHVSPALECGPSGRQAWVGMDGASRWLRQSGRSAEWADETAQRIQQRTQPRAREEVQYVAT